MKIIFYAPAKNSDPWLDAIATALPDAEVWMWTPACAQRQAEYAIVWTPPAELFATQRGLKAVFNIGAGVDGVMALPNLPEDIPLVRLNDAGMAVQMAEYVCHALIRHTREFDVYAAQEKDHQWKMRRPVNRAAFPVGVMGLGSIGTRVSEAVASFGYPTFGWSRSPKSLHGVTTFFGYDRFDDFLHAVRVLVCILPLTPETEGILNRATLSKLKPNGYLINVGRGRHLVEEDLLALLADGTLAGAALDVVREEPLPAHHAFWAHPKITLTPHIAGLTLRDQSVAQIANKIRALARGEAVDGVVDFKHGY
jgi:glyoxylate/hydroxypyruvate reductase A